MYFILVTHAEVDHIHNMNHMELPTACLIPKSDECPPAQVTQEILLTAPLWKDARYEQWRRRIAAYHILEECVMRDGLVKLAACNARVGEEADHLTYSDMGSSTFNSIIFIPSKGTD